MFKIYRRIKKRTISKDYKEEIQIILDEPSYEDSIDGTTVHASYTTNIIRTGKEPLN